MQVTLYDAAILAFLFRDDLHTLHHNVTGIDFKDTHEWLGELYDRALSDFDYFMEHAILTDEIEYAPNMTDILRDLSKTEYDNWQPVKGGKAYTVEETMKIFQEKWEDYQDVYDAVRDYEDKKNNNDITSDIDSMKSAWSIDVKYKAKRTTQ
jgi:DNA-binding ferritin-like protein